MYRGGIVVNIIAITNIIAGINTNELPHYNHKFTFPNWESSMTIECAATIGNAHYPFIAILNIVFVYPKLVIH